MNPILVDLPMPILTPRLRIQPRHVGEGKVLNDAICASLEHLKPWMPFAQKAPTLEESEEHCRKALAEFILRENITLSIYDRFSGAFVGSTGLHRAHWGVRRFEIGYWIAEQHGGKGFATEAAHALTVYAFEVLKARRVEIRCDAENIRSLAVMKRLGFVQEACFRSDSLGVDGDPRDTLVTARYDTQGLAPLDVSWG